MIRCHLNRCGIIPGKSVVLCDLSKDPATAQNTIAFIASPIATINKTPHHQAAKQKQFDNQKHRFESPTKTPSISWKASHFLSITVALNDTRSTKKNNCQSAGALTKTWCKVSYTSPKTYHTPPKMKRFWCMSTPCRASSRKQSCWGSK